MKNYTKLILASCFTLTSYIITAQDIMPANYFYKAMQKSETAVQLLDVRSDAEYKQSHLKDSKQINVLEDNFVERVKTEFSKEKAVFIYCKSGGRSNMAANKLQEAGYKTIDLQGGITAWKLQNLPIISGPED